MPSAHPVGPSAAGSPSHHATDSTCCCRCTLSLSPDLPWRPAECLPPAPPGSARPCWGPSTLRTAQRPAKQPSRGFGDTVGPGGHQKAPQPCQAHQSCSQGAFQTPLSCRANPPPAASAGGQEAPTSVRLPCRLGQGEARCAAPGRGASTHCAGSRPGPRRYSTATDHQHSLVSGPSWTAHHPTPAPCSRAPSWGRCPSKLLLEKVRRGSDRPSDTCHSHRSCGRGGPTPMGIRPTSTPQATRNQDPGESGPPILPAGATGTHLHDQVNRIGHLLQDREAAVRGGGATACPHHQ